MAAPSWPGRVKTGLHFTDVQTSTKDCNAWLPGRGRVHLYRETGKEPHARQDNSEGGRCTVAAWWQVGPHGDAAFQHLNGHAVLRHEHRSLPPGQAWLHGLQRFSAAYLARGGKWICERRWPCRQQWQSRSRILNLESAMLRRCQLSPRVRREAEQVYQELPQLAGAPPPALTFTQKTPCPRLLLNGKTRRRDGATKVANKDFINTTLRPCPYGRFLQSMWCRLRHVQVTQTAVQPGLWSFPHTRPRGAKPQHLMCLLSHPLTTPAQAKQAAPLDDDDDDNGQVPLPGRLHRASSAVPSPIPLQQVDTLGPSQRPF